MLKGSTIVPEEILLDLNRGPSKLNKNGSSNEAQRQLKTLCRQILGITRKETPQTWSFVFGDNHSGCAEEIYHIRGITRRNIWMESHFIFNQIKALQPDETFHPPESYILIWKPPGSSFRMAVPLVDTQIQESTVNEISGLTRFRRNGILFYFSCAEPSEPLFAPRAHPSSLVSYRSKNAVMEKLCYFYTEEKYPLSSLQSVLSSDYDVWRMTLYDLLSADEQIFHGYLMEKVGQMMTLKKMEGKYQNDEISLEEFTDYRYNERKLRNDTNALEYPRPYRYADCIVCQEIGTATVKCLNCPNMVCKKCITYCFLEEKTKIGSFLYMHRAYCLKRTKVNKFNIKICDEPQYLSDLRENGREVIVDRYVAAANARAIIEQKQNSGAEDSSGDDADSIPSECSSHNNSNFHGTDDEFQRMTVKVVKMKRKYARIKKSILAVQSNMDQKGHIHQYMERLLRIKTEKIQVLNILLDFDMRAARTYFAGSALKDESDHVKATIADLEDLIESAQMLCNIENAETFLSVEKNSVHWKARIENQQVQDLP